MPYFDYFGEAAGPRYLGYYSFDIGAWHILALNSNCAVVNCGPSSLQYAWLQRELIRINDGGCILAYWHHPRFSSGYDGDTTQMIPLFGLLLGARATLALSGHSHDYERFAPQDNASRADPAGVRQFVVGTGGAWLSPIGPRHPNSEFIDNTSFGVLRLELAPGAYAWQFIGVSGRLLDQGVGTCASRSHA